MSEHEQLDRLLRQSLRSSPAAPQLSAAFDKNLERRVRPRKLTANSRRLLIAYALIAAIVSVWALRRAELGWPYVAASIVAALGVAAGIQKAARITTAS